MNQLPQFATVIFLMIFGIKAQGPPEQSPLTRFIFKSIQQLLTIPAGKLYNPAGFTLAPTNEVGSSSFFITDSQAHVVVLVNSLMKGSENISIVAGVWGKAGFEGGGVGKATFNSPTGISKVIQGTDGSRYLLITDTQNNAIRRLDYTENGLELSTLAGSLGSGLRDAQGGYARFTRPAHIRCGEDHSNVTEVSIVCFVADSGNNAVRRVSEDGKVGLLAGNGIAGFSDGFKTGSMFNNPASVVLDFVSGAVLVTDTLNHLIRRVTMEGWVSTVAGSRGSPGYRDGLGANAGFNAPMAIVKAKNEQLFFIADRGNFAIRQMSLAGDVGTLVNASTVDLGNITSIILDANGDILVLARFNKPERSAYSSISRISITRVASAEDTSNVKQVFFVAALAASGMVVSAIMLFVYSRRRSSEDNCHDDRGSLTNLAAAAAATRTATIDDDQTRRIFPMERSESSISWPEAFLAQSNAGATTTSDPAIRYEISGQPAAVEEHVPPPYSPQPEDQDSSSSSSSDSASDDAAPPQEDRESSRLLS